MSRIFGWLANGGEYITNFLTINLGTYFGIPVTLHWLWSVFMLTLTWATYMAGKPQEIFQALAIYAFVLLHEFGHSLTAKRMDVPVDSITIYPFGGVASIHMQPNEPHKEFWVTLMGPMVNVVLFIGFLFSSFLWPQYQGTWNVFMEVNAALVIFNILPIFPMDGGRIFRSLLCRLMHWRSATEVAVRVSHFMSVAVMVLAFYHGYPMVLFIMPLIFIAASVELSRANNFEWIVRTKGILQLIRAGEFDRAKEQVEGIEDANSKKHLANCIIILRDNPDPEKVDQLLAAVEIGPETFNRRLMQLESLFLRSQNEDLDKLIQAIDEGQDFEKIEELIQNMKDVGFREHCLKVLHEAKRLKAGLSMGDITLKEPAEEQA